jgi:hypothetical protein
MDALSASRLPDLPHAGYASRRQKETTDAIMIFMRMVERERPLLLSIVMDGIDKWRKTGGTIWRGLLIDRDILDSIFRYFVLQAGPNPAEQLLILHGQAEYAKRAAWDKRQSTRAQFQKLQKAALADLRHDQRKRRS